MIKVFIVCWFVMTALVLYPLYRAVKKFRTHNKDRWSSHKNKMIDER